MDSKKDKIIIRLIFSYEREVIMFDIWNKIIVYRDRKWKNGFQFMPRDPSIIKTILLSRNAIRHEMINWINDANNGKNLEQYNNAKTDDELVPIIKRDCELKGCVFQKMLYVTIDDKGNEIEVIK